MKLLPLLGVASLAFASACQSQGKYVNKHWDANYVGPSISRHFLNYNPQEDGPYGHFLGTQMDDIRLTLRRHIFNNNPENPFQDLHSDPKKSASTPTVQKDQTPD